MKVTVPRPSSPARRILRDIAKAESMVRQAAAKGAQVILLQELFETPYFCKDHLASHFGLAHPMPDNAVVGTSRPLAKELGVVLSERVRARQ